MPAKRPETRPGSRYAGPRGVLRAAAGWLPGVACLILCAAPAVSRAAAASDKPAATASSKPGATTPDKAAAATPGKAAATTPGRAGATTPGKPGALENSGSAIDSTFGRSDARTPGAGGSASGAAATGGRSAQRSASGGTPATPTARATRGSTGATPAPAGPTPARLAASSAGKPRGIQTVAHLDQKLTYQYNALGRRDPFQPMIGGEFVGADVGGDAPVDVGGMKVVGIVWGTEDKFAMVEDGRGQSLVLRVGDKVMNGVVEGLRRDAVVVRITADGQTQSVAIPLTRKGDKSNATR